MTEANTVIDNLRRAARKIQGIAGLLFVEDRFGCVELTEEQANGIYEILGQISEEIEANADRIVKVKA